MTDVILRISGMDCGALVLLIGLRVAGILPGLRSTETELPGACSLNARTRRRFAGRSSSACSRALCRAAG